MDCPACNNRIFSKIVDKGSLKLVKCLSCNLVMLGDMLESFDINNYGYYKDRISLPIEKLYNPITTKRYISLLSKLEHYKKNNMLLDIGCGMGHFLFTAKTYGWQVKGIEIAPYAIEICKRFNIGVECSNFLKLNIEPDSYDVITMFEVLEHLTRPREYLLKVNQILRKEGVLVITTPNFNCITRLILGKRWNLINKEHLSYFTPTSLKELIKKCHFEIIDFKIKNITFLEFLLFFKVASNDVQRYNEELRNVIEENNILSSIKKITNIFLNITRIGETIDCICQKN